MENNVRFAGVNTDAKALEEQNEKLKKTVNDLKIEIECKYRHNKLYSKRFKD